MDELKLLRELRIEHPTVKESVINDGRAQLLQHIVSPGIKKNKRRSKTALRVSLMAAATFGLVTVLVGTNVVGLAGWRGAASAQAAEVLNNAAALTIKTVDPRVGPGQYLKVESTNLSLSTYGVQDTSGIVGSNDHVEWTDTEKRSLYVPANRDQEWVWERSGRVPTTFFGDKSKEVAYQQAKEQGESAQYLSAVNGAFYDSPSTFPSTKELAAYPRDPRMLLNKIYLENIGSGQSIDGQALVFIADLLRTGLVPADLRSALYKAAAMIPGVVVTENQATLDDQQGISIGRVETVSNFRQDIIIDPETGQLIGERQVTLEPLGSVPAGSTIGWTTIRTTVVDSAP
ncbi:hypothetical protein CQ018_08385 [Arthrobacter sp. MYb227]|uniref:CU044_5270 family protein n=1 Tax=Arthrobacter sp. MYb227 TaxID=1848601 RepID=UPI000CFCCE37|nr:CU044_5270 family protein [Arthrobacter sp. MYb227]PQZ93668.1 hypothetical protein CQ018_08385 [Arthrobacter sp. MYb227]